MDIKLTKKEFRDLCNSVEREHGPYCLFCGKVMVDEERDIVSRMSAKAMSEAARKSVPAGFDGRAMGEAYRVALRLIQLDVQYLRLAHKKCLGAKMVDHKVKEIKNPGKVSSDTRELASELLMLDSMRMIITDMLDKNPNPEEMDEESLRQLSTAWIRFKVIEWLDTGIKLSERFACHRCDVGECCTDSIVEIRPNEVEPMAAYLRMTPELFLKKFTYLSQEKPFLRAPCPFYKRGKKESRHPSCLIYPVRPLVCRIFPLTGLFIVRNVERCPMARDIVMALADVDTKSIDLSVLEKRIKPYIERSINDEKNLNPEEISDKLEEAMVERLPEDAKLMKSKSRQNMRVNPLVFRALLDRLMIRGKR